MPNLMSSAHFVRMFLLHCPANWDKTGVFINHTLSAYYSNHCIRYLHGLPFTPFLQSYSHFYKDIILSSILTKRLKIKKSKSLAQSYKAVQQQSASLVCFLSLCLCFSKSGWWLRCFVVMAFNCTDSHSKKAPVLFSSNLLTWRTTQLGGSVS